MQKKLDTVENNIKALKQIEMINPLHILEGWRNVILLQFKELIQSVSAEKKSYLWNVLFIQRIIKQLE
jgi:hypothetical protein